MSKSIWQGNLGKFSYTKKSIDCDVLIIGGGMAGITTALMLLDSEKRVVVIDSNRIGSGITSRTTGKISVMQGYNYQNIFNISKSNCYEYLDSQFYSVNLLVDLIKKYNIDCDLKKNDSYLFTNSNDNIDKIMHEKSILDRVIKCSVVNKLPNGYSCLYGIKTDFSYVFNPIKYINSVRDLCSNKINIYEYTKALDLSKKLDYFLIRTNKNKIKAKQVIICTHYPILVKKLFFPIVTNITKEFVLGAGCDKVYNSNMISNDDSVISMRYYDNNILFASGDDLLGGKLNYQDLMYSVTGKFNRHFNFPIKYTWYNYDITSCDLLPIIGEVQKNVFVATAFNKWGMSNSALAASILSDFVLGKKNRFSDLVSIDRSSLRNSSCIKNIFDNVVTYFKPKGNISYEVCDGVKCAVYTDSKGVKHKVVNKCPHLGCSLIFNDLDKTWDCPCHGSRYDIDGNVIHGPSVYSIKRKKTR